MGTPAELPTIEVYSDLHCPWGYLATFRLMELQQEWSGRLRVAWRCLPLEVANSRGTPKNTLDQEVPICYKFSRTFRRGPGDAPNGSTR